MSELPRCRGIACLLAVVHACVALQAHAANPADAPAAVAHTGSASNAASAPRPVQHPATVELYVGESRVLAGLKATRVAVGAERLLNATVLDNDELLLFGNGAGQSTMQVWTKDGGIVDYLITVRPVDMSRLQTELASLFSDLTTLSIRRVGDKVVLDGHSLSEEQLAKIHEIAARYPQVVNLTQFQRDRAWEKMVLMDIKVVEFKNRDKVRELGIRWDDAMNGPSFGIAADVKASPLRNGNRFLVNPPQGANIVNAEDLPRPLAPMRTYLGIISVLNARINLMEQDGDAVVLAQPQLTTRSGRQAEFHVGGEIPYAAVSQLGQSTVSFRNYGIEIKIKPWVDRLGQIQSDLSAELSEPDHDINPRSGIPGLRTRKATTSFNVRAGETMVVAGLLQRRKGEAVAQVPGFGSLPVVGQLFKSRRSIDSDSELVVFVTPTVLDPSDAAHAERLGGALLRAERYLEPPAPAPAPLPNPFQDAP
jgi:pilus assembly protein CpaC